MDNWVYPEIIQYFIERREIDCIKPVPFDNIFLIPIIDRDREKFPELINYDFFVIHDGLENVMSGWKLKGCPNKLL